VFVRQQKVLLDDDLAELYGVTAKHLNHKSSATQNASLRISLFAFLVKGLQT